MTRAGPRHLALPGAEGAVHPGNSDDHNVEIRPVQRNEPRRLHAHRGLFAARSTAAGLPLSGAWGRCLGGGDVGVEEDGEEPDERGEEEEHVARELPARVLPRRRW